MVKFDSIRDCGNTLNIPPTKDITVSLISNGNKIIDYVLNNISGAESQCDLVNKDSFLPCYVKTFKTKAKSYKHNNKLDIITLNNEPVKVFVNEDEHIVDKYLWKLQDNTSIDDMFRRTYDLVTIIK